MKIAIAVVAAVLGLCGVAQGAPTSSACRAPATFNPMEFTCSHSFVARRAPQVFHPVNGDWHEYASRWEAGDRQFVTLPPVRPWCRTFGRYGELRVRENSCGARVTISVRSVGAPTPVTYQWEVLR